MVAERERRFREEAPTTAAAAATIILDGVKADRLRILVGEDAERLADLVKELGDRRDAGNCSEWPPWVEWGSGAAAVGRACLFPPLSSGGALVARP
jgi:hypothetical protein